MKAKIIAIVVLLVIAGIIIYSMFKAPSSSKDTTDTTGSNPEEETKQWYNEDGLTIAPHDYGDGSGRITFTLNNVKFIGYPQPCVGSSSGGLRASSDQARYGVPCLKAGFIRTKPDGK